MTLDNACGVPGPPIWDGRRFFTGVDALRERVPPPMMPLERMICLSAGQTKRAATHLALAAQSNLVQQLPVMQDLLLALALILR